MLRAPLLYLSNAGWAKKMTMNMPLARRVAHRFVAGETQKEALEVVKELNARGITATLDVLGESVTDAAMARADAETYLRLIEGIRDAGLKSSVSLKLTQIGLDIDPAVCRQNMRDILNCARDAGITVTIDMESSDYTQRTLDFFHEMLKEGYSNLLTVIQSYLYRSEDDVCQLANDQGASLRLCKGAYQEPPTVAYPKKSDVDDAYVRDMKILLKAANEGKGYPGIATHDLNMIEATKAYAAENNIPSDKYEFQMLYGIRSNLQDQLAKEGYGMRVYVPFGTEWYPYFMRRLAERPANMWFFVSNLVRR